MQTGPWKFLNPFVLRAKNPKIDRAKFVLLKLVAACVRSTITPGASLRNTAY